MQMRYALSEVKTGLRRNVSMTVALVVTIFISLTLVGMGLLLNAQANSARETWGDKLQITVQLCTKASKAPHCSSGEVTPKQKETIVETLKSHPEVKSYTERSKQEAYDIFKKLYAPKDRNAVDRSVFEAVTPDKMNESYLVSLKDPNKYRGIEDALSGMEGVDHVQDLRDVLEPIYFWMNIFKWGALGVAGFLLVAAVLQVSNSIRLAVFARRKEIGIMRLVGASNLYISLPFLLETLVAALIAIALSWAAVGAFMQFAVYGWLRPHSRVMAWIGWQDAFTAGWFVLGTGVLLTVVPTLVMTRKYLKV